MTRNSKLALCLAVVVVGMAGLTRASVPLYYMFCAATGYGGTPQIGGQGPTAEVARPITIAMNADTSPQLPWAFEPEKRSVTMNIGEAQLAFYDGKNLSDHTITGHALYNVTPDSVGHYFHKTECFCFTSQTLAAGEKVQFPVTFWIDPAILQDPETKDIHTITLSYTFFPSLADAAKSGALAKAGPHTGNTGVPVVLEPGASRG